MALNWACLTMAADCDAALGSDVDKRAAPCQPRRSIQGVTPLEALANEPSVSNCAAIRELGSLMAAIRVGNEAALGQLYDATVGKLYALAVAILRSAEDSEEVVCDTYAYAWANAWRYDPRRANVLGWLLMLCRSRALDRLRQRRATADLMDAAELEARTDAAIEQPDDILSLMQQHSSIYAALSKLTPQRRRLITLAFLRGLSHQEIAHATGLPLGTIKSHVRRALAQLRETLEET
jgi:RNA polymerase sigma factor (sigma-70 family)